MARDFNVNTQKQNFLRESYYKETLSRVLWHEKYYDETRRLNKMRDPSEAEIRGLRLQRLHEGVPKFPKGKVIPKLTYPKKPKSKRDELEEDRKLVAERADDLCDMRPVSPGTRELLYDGFTKEEKGRYQYLKARKQKIPEVRYEFPITSSWELGWRQHEAIEDFFAPIHGRSRIVKDTFYRKNKAFNDPIPLSMLRS